MDIKYLPEITEPQSNDWLIIQRGDLTGKIKYSNLNIRLPDPDPDPDPDPTPIGDEDDMYMGINPPNNPVPGKLWGELDNNDLLIQTWIWQKHPVSNSYRWMSNTKFFTFPTLFNDSRVIIEIGSKFDYLIKGFEVSAGYPANATLSLYSGNHGFLFGGSKLAELNFPNANDYGVNSINLQTAISTLYYDEAMVYNNLLGVEMVKDSANHSFYATAKVTYQLVKKS